MKSSWYREIYPCHRVCILSPTLDLSAVGQDELLESVYAQFTIQSPCFLHLDGFVAMLLVGIYPKKYL